MVSDSFSDVADRGLHDAGLADIPEVHHHRVDHRAQDPHDADRDHDLDEGKTAPLPHGARFLSWAGSVGTDAGETAASIISMPRIEAESRNAGPSCGSAGGVYACGKPDKVVKLVKPL